MRGGRFVQAMAFLATGAMLLQLGGCTFSEFNEVLQTVLLGVTAAGGIAILRNI